MEDGVVLISESVTGFAKSASDCKSEMTHSSFIVFVMVGCWGQENAGPTWELRCLLLVFINIIKFTLQLHVRTRLKT